MNNAEAHAILYDEMRAALMNDPRVVVTTPAYKDVSGKPRKVTAAEVLADEMTPAEMVYVLRIVASAAKAGNVQAQAWIDAQANAHARAHELDMVAEADDEVAL